MYIFNAAANLVPRVLSYLPYGARAKERETLGATLGTKLLAGLRYLRAVRRNFQLSLTG